MFVKHILTIFNKNAKIFERSAIEIEKKLKMSMIISFTLDQLFTKKETDFFQRFIISNVDMTDKKENV